MSLNKYLFPALILISIPRIAAAQSATSSGGVSLSLVAGILLVAAAGVIFILFRRKTADPKPEAAPQSDFNKALDKALDATTAKPEPAAGEVRVQDVLQYGPDQILSAQLYQMKQRRMQFDRLPINSFQELREPRTYDLLPLSSDEPLLAAIERCQEDAEPEESARIEAVGVLAEFKARNSADALAQLAIYDLSSNVRTKAVMTLAEFDHESVFEAVLLACADPTREVRAAAARALFKLSFDRADAWMRIIASRDGYRMNHAARAAIEAGIVERSFDRLLHEDAKIAYEAFVLIGLMIRAGETEEIFDMLRKGSDERVKFALLHVIAVLKDERAISKLDALSREDSFSPEVAAKIDEVVATYELAAA